MIGWQDPDFVTRTALHLPSNLFSALAFGITAIAEPRQIAIKIGARAELLIMKIPGRLGGFIPLGEAIFLEIGMFE